VKQDSMNLRLDWVDRASCLDLGQYTFRRTLIERPQMATKVYRPMPSLQTLVSNNVLA
jgi:hypothetical protein